MKTKIILTLALLSVMMTSCTTVPHSSPVEDATAKAFRTNPHSANLYIFRERGFLGARVGWDVALDGRTLAVLTTGTYVVREIEPGQHTLSRRESVFPIRLDAGHNHFVRFEASLTAPDGTTFREVSEQEGKGVVLNLPRVVTLY